MFLSLLWYLNIKDLTTLIRGARNLSTAAGIGKQLKTVVNLSGTVDYKLSFQLKPWNKVLSWGSIFHFTATGNNCCEYGDRIPALWFNPGSFKLHLIDGHSKHGNVACKPQQTPRLPISPCNRLNVKNIATIFK